MAFKKAVNTSKFARVGIMGLSGAGKTFTSLLLGEYLAAEQNKRLAVVDLDGKASGFYADPCPSRLVHPLAFDFDVTHTKSVTDVINNVANCLPVKTYGCLIIDTISTVWEACQNMDGIKRTSAGTVSAFDWRHIKAPYKKLMRLLINLEMHVIICAREATKYKSEVNKKGKEEMVVDGYKMEAEKNTEYETTLFLRMERVDDNNVAYVIRDRASALTGKSFKNPTGESLGVPILAGLGKVHEIVESEDDVAMRDAAALDANRDAVAKSIETATIWIKKIEAADTVPQLKGLNGSIGGDIDSMRKIEADSVRGEYTKRLKHLQGR
jgi:hypothetical protein